MTSASNRSATPRPVGRELPHESLIGLQSLRLAPGLRLDLLDLGPSPGLDQLRLARALGGPNPFMISWRLPGKIKSLMSARAIETP